VEHVVVTNGLTRTFGAVTAVRDVSLAVRAGEMFGLVGPDGAGKTTLIRLLCGLLTPDAGTGSVLGHDLRRDPGGVKRSIGYLSQRFSLYGDLTVDENIEFFAGINGVRDYRGRRDELLAFTRLTPFRDRLAERLSGGMKQKLGLACTLIHTPRLLFLDEPTTGVDPVSRRDFWRILQSLLQRGITVVMSTPYLDEAERCTRVALLDGGAVMRAESPEALKREMTGEVFEVVCSPVRGALPVLRSLEGVREVQAFGDRVNVVVHDANDVQMRIARALRGAGVETGSVRRIQPSLENVFISLITSRDEARVEP
jgi:ABC-2 type transport system ATP-binding protein